MKTNELAGHFFSLAQENSAASKYNAAGPAFLKSENTNNPNTSNTSYQGSDDVHQHSNLDLKTYFNSNKLELKIDFLDSKHGNISQVFPKTSSGTPRSLIDSGFVCSNTPDTLIANKKNHFGDIDDSEKRNKTAGLLEEKSRNDLVKKKHEEKFHQPPTFNSIKEFWDNKDSKTSFSTIASYRRRKVKPPRIFSSSTAPEYNNIREYWAPCGNIFTPSYLLSDDFNLKIWNKRIKTVIHQRSPRYLSTSIAIRKPYCKKYMSRYRKQMSSDFINSKDNYVSSQKEILEQDIVKFVPEIEALDWVVDHKSRKIRSKSIESQTVKINDYVFGSIRSHSIGSTLQLEIDERWPFRVQESNLVDSLTVAFISVTNDVVDGLENELVKRFEEAICIRKEANKVHEGNVVNDSDMRNSEEVKVDDSEKIVKTEFAVKNVSPQVPTVEDYEVKMENKTLESSEVVVADNGKVHSDDKLLKIGRKWGTLWKMKASRSISRADNCVSSGELKNMGNRIYSLKVYNDSCFYIFYVTYLIYCSKYILMVTLLRSILPTMECLYRRFLIDTIKIATFDIDQESLQALFCSCQSPSTDCFYRRNLIDITKTSSIDIDQESLQVLFRSCQSTSVWLRFQFHQVMFMQFFKSWTKEIFKHELLYYVNFVWSFCVDKKVMTLKEPALHTSSLASQRLNVVLMKFSVSGY